MLLMEFVVRVEERAPVLFGAQRRVGFTQLGDSP